MDNLNLLHGWAINLLVGQMPTQLTCFLPQCCECEKVRPLCDELLQLINDELKVDYLFDNFDRIFGVSEYSFVYNLFNFML